MVTPSIWQARLTTPDEVRTFYDLIGRPKHVWVACDSDDWWFGQSRIELARAYLRWDERHVEVHFAEPTDEARNLYGDQVSGAFVARNLPEEETELLISQRVQDRFAAAMPPSQDIYTEIFLDEYSRDTGDFLLSFDMNLLEIYLQDWSDELSQS